MDKAGLRLKHEYIDEEKQAKAIPLMLEADNDKMPKHYGLKRQLFEFEGSIRHEDFMEKIKEP